MKTEEEFQRILRLFANAYLAQKNAMEEENSDEKSMTHAVNQYMETARKFLEFVTAAYGQEEPELPDMDIYFKEGMYNDFARRIYAGILYSGQFPGEILWKLKMRVFLGDLLREKLNKEKTTSKGGKII